MPPRLRRRSSTSRVPLEQSSPLRKQRSRAPPGRSYRGSDIRSIPVFVTPAQEDVIQFSPRKAAEKFGPITRVSGQEEQLLNTGKLMFPQAVPEEFAKSSRF